MPVVHVRIVWMAMCEHRMMVYVGVRFPAIPAQFMRVLVMLVVHMHMTVRQLFVRMLVLMMLGQVQPDAHSHQRCGNPEGRRKWFVQ